MTEKQSKFDSDGTELTRTYVFVVKDREDRDAST